MKLIPFITILTLGFLMLFIDYGCTSRRYDCFNTQHGAGVRAQVETAIGQDLRER